MPALSEEKRAYIREYKQRKYAEDNFKEKKYQSSLKIKKKYDVSPEMWNFYKHYLIDAFNLSKIIKTMPYEMLLEVLENPLELAKRDEN